jgi:manganese-dependent inorganic pyrophosphatase
MKNDKIPIFDKQVCFHQYTFMDEKTVYIIGHKNPDTDSGVAAVSYARLKELLGFKNYVAARAGHFAPQTEYIFNRFKVPYPKFISDLVPKVAYYMTGSCDTVDEDESVWDAIGKMDESKSRVLPVVDKDGKYMALLHYSVFAQNVLTVMNPEHRTAFPTSIRLITHTMNAQPLIVKNEDDVFKASVLVGAASIERFRKMLASHQSENIVVIASDRREIQEACIEAGIKLLIITSGHPLDKDLRDKAEEEGVSVIISPYATSSTAMLIAYSTPVSVMADMDITPVHPDDTVAKVRPLLQESPCRCLPVVDAEKRIIGLLSEHDLLREPNIELILVDHNEMTQAVEGVEHYRIQEVIDHHRLGTLSTEYPITFINKPVGSTSTLITNLYREYKVPIPMDIASLLLCGILSDTLILQSTTTTEIDRETATYLSDITNLEIKTLGDDIIKAGSHIEGRSAGELIHQDMKEYNQGKENYTVSQIEVDNTKEILDRKKEFMQELEIERRAHKAIFTALLVTDITQLSSILLLEYDPKFESFVTFPKLEDNVYYLKDVVSRKKQLIPFMTEQVENYER